MTDFHEILSTGGYRLKELTFFHLGDEANHHPDPGCFVFVFPVALVEVCTSQVLLVEESVKQTFYLMLRLIRKHKVDVLADG